MNAVEIMQLAWGLFGGLTGFIAILSISLKVVSFIRDGKRGKRDELIAEENLKKGIAIGEAKNIVVDCSQQFEKITEVRFADVLSKQNEVVAAVNEIGSCVKVLATVTSTFGAVSAEQAKELRTAAANLIEVKPIVTIAPIEIAVEPKDPNIELKKKRRAVTI